MTDFLRKIFESIAGYKTSRTHKSVFQEISGYYYHENFHSDILAYYLKNNTVKSCFIDWLNQKAVDGKEPLRVEYYIDGLVAREHNRADITLFSVDNARAIIIENKSNNALDQAKQIHRYHTDLSNQGVEVERIFYLNKNSLKSPYLEDLQEAEKRQLEEILIVGQLVGYQSFTENVINRVLAMSNEIRLSALSQEIRDLFLSVTYGGINMEYLSSFVDELKRDGNLDRLRKAIQAYGDIPIYLTKVYETYLIKKETGHKIFLHKPTCLVIDNIFRNGKRFAIDIWFSNEKLDFSILVRGGSDSDVEKLKEETGEKFPFCEFLYGRYRFFCHDPLMNNAEIKQILDQLLETFKIA